MGPSPPELIAILMAMGTPAFIVFYFGKRWFQLKEKRLEIDAAAAAEKAAQYVSHSREIEQRLAVLERIVTEGNHSLSREIDALALEKPRQREIAQ
jgi:hypothetical protein